MDKQILPALHNSTPLTPANPLSFNGWRKLPIFASMNPTTKYRLRAILLALWFSVRPSRMYEKTPHYDCTYWQHLYINLCYVYRWATFTETQSDRDFEKKANG